MPRSAAGTSTAQVTECESEQGRTLLELTDHDGVRLSRDSQTARWSSPVRPGWKSLCLVMPRHYDAAPAARSRQPTGRRPRCRGTDDLLVGSWKLIQQLGRVPRRPIWDNEPGVGRGERRAAGVRAIMGTLATKPVLLLPSDPEFKGVVELIRYNGASQREFAPFP